MIALNSTWYRPPSLETRLNDSELSRRLADFHAWYEDQHSKPYEHQEAGGTDFRAQLLKPVRVIGTKEGMEVTIKTTTPAMGLWEFKDEIVVSKNKSAPGFYVVSHGGNRLDSFLKLANAKAFTERYLVQP